MLGGLHLTFFFCRMAAIAVCILEGSSDVKGTVLFEDMVRQKTNLIFLEDNG